MQTDALEFPNKRRNMLLAAMFAVTAMLAFTLTHGIVKIQSTEETDYSFDDEDDF